MNRPNSEIDGSVLDGIESVPTPTSNVSLRPPISLRHGSSGDCWSATANLEPVDVVLTLNNDTSVSRSHHSLVHDSLPHTRKRSSTIFVEEEEGSEGSIDITHAQLSLRTVFVCGFLIFVVALGCSLLSTSYFIAEATNRMQREQTRALSANLFDLVDETEGRLIESAESSFGELISHSVSEMSRQIAHHVADFASSAKRSVLAMEDLWKKGDLDPINLDRTLDQMWAMILLYPEVSMINFADAVDGNFVAIQRLPNGQFGVELKNTTSASCFVCQSGAVAEYKYYYTVSHQYQAPTIKDLNLNQTYDPRMRDWYQTGIEGDGEIKWADMRIFSSGISIGAMITKLIRDEKGKDLGVVGSDMDVAAMSIFLNERRKVLAQNLLALSLLDITETSEMIGIVVMDEHGYVLGETHPAEENFDPWFAQDLDEMHFSVRFSEGCITRTAIDLVETHFGGSFESAMQAGFAVIPSESSHLVTSMTYNDNYGLRLMIVTVVDNQAYRGHFQTSIDSTRQLIARELNSTAVEIDQMSAKVKKKQDGNNIYALLICVLITSLGGAVMFCFTNHVTRSLRDLASRMALVSGFEFVSHAPPQDERVQEISRIGSAFHDMLVNLQSFALYVPESVTRLLVSQKAVAVLGVAPQMVSIMFSDIVGFTSIAETLEPSVLISILAEYLEAMSDCIQKYDGTVGKYIGDGIFCFWNSPFEVDDHACMACASALRQQEVLALLREKWIAEGLPPIRARMGLSFGSVLHGNIGSRKHMEWGLIGDEVNLTSRLESMCKQYGTNILISGSLHAQVKDHYVCRHIDTVIAVGKSTPTEIYDLITHKDTATPQQLQYAQDFEAVIVAYRGRCFAEALELLETYQSEFREDGAAILYVERCRTMLQSPPDDDWQGTAILTEK